MIEPEKKDLAAFLSDQLEGTWQHLALYYAAYYWHLNGNAGNALHCLYRFLETEPNSMPARFQLGVLYIKLGKFKKAISFLEPITKKLRCSDCFLALGDAHVLDGNFRSAITAFDDAHAIEAEENSAKKAALLRCILKIFEVMEHQHTNLLDTIEDVKAYRQKKVAVPLG
ncbi:tetratricopeptide repeat domain 17 [Aphelenchoides avenae]|nr:tetratricopeptide repeat domain 17 [Aphelenchus avenae]